ncbi:helicase associated domain-containing protein [Streptomyces massasporeus]|uniref:helicase associated domain-containing protein n=1 Tax=Streptomyces massasporeus TaxID=67324 RepID=UPI0033B48507
MRVPTDYQDAYGYRLGTFIAGQRTARRQGILTEGWIAELDALGMIWDDHEAVWQGHLTTITAFHTEQGPPRHPSPPARRPVPRRPTSPRPQQPPPPRPTRPARRPRPPPPCPLRGG